VAIDLSDELAKGLLAFAFVAILGGAASVLWGNIKYQHELDVKTPLNKRLFGRA
jgi:hypothetical protein